MRLTHLSTAATIGDMVTAAVMAVAASTKTLTNICPLSEYAVDIVSKEFGVEECDSIASIKKQEAGCVRDVG